MRARQIEAIVHPSEACVVDGDQVLCSSAGQPVRQRHGRDGRDSSRVGASPSAPTSGRTMAISVRDAGTLAGAPHAVHPICHDESELPG
jgi:hypothetical protein